MKPLTDVVGLDLSATSCGIAWASGCMAVTHPPTPGGTLSDWAYRLQALTDEVCARVEELSPRLVVLEAPILPRPFGKKGSSFAISGNYHERAGLYWLVVCRLKELGLQLHTVSPRTIKLLLTGNSSADKKSMKAAAMRYFPSHWVRTDDEADALACCAAGHEWIGSPMLTISKDQRETLIPPPWASDEEHEAHSKLIAKRKRQSKPRQTKSKKKVLTEAT